MATKTFSPLRMENVTFLKGKGFVDCPRTQEGEDLENNVKSGGFL